MQKLFDSIRGYRTARTLLLGATAALSLAMAGCDPSDTQAGASSASGAPSAKSGSAATAQEQLQAAVEKLWTARVNEDWRTAFEFLPPDVRARSNPDQYIQWAQAEEPFIVSAFTVKSIEIDGELGWVDVTNDVAVRKMMGEKPRTVTTIEKWLLTDGQWMPVIKEQFDAYPGKPSERSASEEARLRERFELAASLREKADWPAVFEFVEPADREMIPFDSWEHSVDAITVLSHETLWVEAIEHRGRVRAKYRQKINDPNLTKLQPEDFLIIERWIAVDGQWYIDLLDNARAASDRSKS
jgi:hypothetical protein